MVGNFEKVHKSWQSSEKATLEAERNYEIALQDIGKSKSQVEKVAIKTERKFEDL